jgi:hypothetical protein
MEKESFDTVFSKLKSILQSFSPPLKVTKESEKDFELYTTKEGELAGRKFPHLFFSGIKIQKGFVGFYFFPVYTHPELLKKYSPELRKCLKGKSCFHIQKDDDKIFLQIENAVKDGFECYKKKSFI